MANLKSNGTEVARFVRNRERKDPGVLRDQTFVSVRSNGKVLRKHIAVIIDVYYPKGFRAVTNGWKRWLKYENDGQLATLEQSLTTAGFTKL